MRTILVCTLFLVATTAQGGVIVVANTTADAVTLNLKPDDRDAWSPVVGQGETRILNCDKSISITLNGETLKLDAYNVYVLRTRRGAVSLEGIQLAGQPPVGTVPIVDGEPKVTVKLLVDQHERRVQQLWEASLRKRFDQAAQIVQTASGVKFELVAVERWDSDPDALDIKILGQDFERNVKPAPAMLAISYTNKKFPPNAAGTANTSLAAPTTLLKPHILLREAEPRNEAERVEVLVHHLGRYLGAIASPEPASAMRLRLGDGQAAATRFRIGFDPLNTLALAIVAEEMRSGKVKAVGDLSAIAQLRLGRIYGTLAPAVPEEPLPETYFGFLERAGIQPNEVAVADPAGGAARPKSPKVEKTRTPREDAVRSVVQAIVRRADANSKLPTGGTGAARVKGDALTAAYVREAALAANTVDEDLRAAAFVLGLGIALDDSTILRDKPLVGSFCKAVESDDERRTRVAVLGVPTIHFRRDLCQHFVVSAALTEMVGADAAEAAGLLKEEMDMTRASGFSFTDLCADFAGIELAKLVKAQPKLLPKLAESFTVNEYVPSIEGFREGLSKDRFVSEFGGRSDARFKTAYADVWTRVKQLPVYRAK